MTTITATPDTATGSVTLQLTQTSSVTAITRSNANGVSDVRVATGQLPSAATGTTIITDYEAAHGINTYNAYVTDVATRTNLALDPAATAVTNWTNIGSATHTRAVDTTVKHQGTNSIKYTVTGAGQLGGKAQISNPGFATGDTIKWSIWVYPSVTMNIQPYWERTTPTYTGGNGGAAVSCPANTWTQLTGSLTLTSAQADASGSFGFGLYSTTAWAVGDFFYADEAIVERNVSAVGAYFDGATPDATDVDYAWTGTANASTSTETTTTRQVTASATLTIDKPWLLVPIAPNYSEQVATVLNYSAGHETHSTVHNIIGRADPLVVMGKLGTRTGRLEFYAESPSDVQRLARVFDRGEAVMMKQLVPGMDMYLAATSLDIQPLSVEGPDVTRYQFTVNYQEVTRPFGDLAGALGWTFDALAADYASFDAVTAAFASFDDLTLMDTK